MDSEDPPPAPPDASEATVASQDAAAPGSDANARSSRKRTKTGCLTCRRRRIKCGEERPICSNCIKSKRNCEGYNQRVIFKSSMTEYRLGPLGGPPDLSDPHPHDGVSGPAQLSPYDLSLAEQGPYASIAPRPPHPYGYPLPDSAGPPSQAPILAPPDAPALAAFGTPAGPEHRLEHRPLRLRNAYEPGDPAIIGHAHAPPELAFRHLEDPPGGPPRARWPSVSDVQRSASNPLSPGYISTAQAPPRPPAQTLEESYGPYVTTQPTPVLASPVEYSGPRARARPARLDFSGSARSGSGRAPGSEVPSPRGSFGHEPFPGPGIGPAMASYPFHPHPTPLHSGITSTPIEASPSMVRNYYGAPMRVEGRSDDSGTDDDVDLDLPDPDVTSGSQHGLSVIRAVQAVQNDRPVRTFRDFLDHPNVLATYRPSPLVAPLMDPQTARIFCHFITATGPSFSIYERHPSNTSVFFTGQPVPRSQQSLWSYSMPTLALQSSPLMHAMLALGSLHISKLQGGTTVPSLKHYHMALRRVAQHVGDPQKRGEVATLAATLLLGFWEVMAAEHAKWSSHLLGARQLLMETDFVGMTRKIRALKTRREAERKRLMSYGLDESATPGPIRGRKLREDVSLGDKQDVDEDLVSLFMGRRRRHDGFGQVLGDAREGPSPDRPATELTTRDLEEYEMRRDLFWWFAKQDSYQSILSGNGLLSEYSCWGDCPPRAAMGRRDAPYGSTDHLILLMGRIADFAARDQRRKRKSMDANGGRWRPPADMDLGPAAQASPPPPPAMPSAGHPPTPTPAPHPMMYGMIPAMGPSRMPPAFLAGGHASPASSSSEELELDAAAAAAEDEWSEIKRALLVFAECLGPAFQPLSAEHMAPIATPFGPALVYRTYSIACLWAVYHMARIVLQRSHPCMPPVAMMAAGIAARTTAALANEIGRIASGLFLADGAQTPITPTLGAALSECSMAVFFAGVQYQDPAQRAWTIHLLLDVARQTGWDSIAAIAHGCETAWEKAGQMGRGPPYTRVLPGATPDDRIFGPRRRDYTVAGVEQERAAGHAAFQDHAGMRLHYALGVLEND
ncbi:MAG: hypothetical protein M1826_007192 [Phylliscum demangeonii]|nr:MAG: hypothetical protein M1826_007192 [Phylliscum demangeonii]